MFASPSIQEYWIQSATWTKFADSTVYSVRTLYIECYLKMYISLVLGHVCFSVFSALEIFLLMRYINLRLLTCLILDTPCRMFVFLLVVHCVLSSGIIKETMNE